MEQILCINVRLDEVIFMKTIRAFTALMLVITTAAGATGCAQSVQAANLMRGVKPGDVSGKPADSAFKESMADFAIKLFKESISEQDNSLVSPLSVALALSMTANGAQGETLAQMEKMLGGHIPLAELNQYLYSYTSGLTSTGKTKFAIANSIWFRGDKDRLQVNSAFLQTNADYYGADAFASAFDSKTVSDINNWVRTNTDGMIDEILDRIDPNNIMFLINAVVFDAEWKNVYYKQNVRKGDFTDISGLIQNVDFMHCAEYGFIDDGMATGFIKPYSGGGYSFVALLPNEDIPIERYVQSLNGAGFLNALNSADKEQLVLTSMPKFKFEYSIEMKDVLRTLGMIDAFDPADSSFGELAVSSDGNVYVSRVIHKTFIEVDERGTKAGAATMVSVSDGAVPSEDKTVELNRPFVFAIVDNATNLPIFIGTVVSIG